jgi:hypothetical protein
MKFDITVRTVLILAMVLSAACHRPRTGDLNGCPYSDAEYSRRIGAAGDLRELYALYQANTGRCATKNGQGAYSHQLVQQLATNWQELPQLAQSVQVEAPLASFLYGHITRDADAVSLKLLLNNTRTQCPANAGPVCDQLGWRAQAALISQGVSN